MQPYEKQISSSVINLLRSCPADAVATRKELLVATRHILATDFRKGFYTEVCVGGGVGIVFFVLLSDLSDCW